MNNTETRHSIWELATSHEELVLPKPLKKSGNRVHLLALGDVGATLLLGLRILGEEIIDTIGIYDLDENVIKRFEIEMNQIGWPLGTHKLPKVCGISEEELFDCDMFIFCASKGIPPIGTQGDVRMLQLEANSKIAEIYAKKAKEANFQGIFAVVSDPVDPLAKVVLKASGLKPAQVRGYGLGVMNKRAEYFSREKEEFAMYPTEGRGFGPHGTDLVIANSIENYDDRASQELTRLTVEANLRVRELGFKPFYAPAFSSGAISILLTLKEEWCYSSVYIGTVPRKCSADLNSSNDCLESSQMDAAETDYTGAFLGILNRIQGDAVYVEDLELPESLYKRIEKAYKNLLEIN